MIPIYEQGKGKGIGHTFDTFLSRFIEICEGQLEDGRSKAFAFILYDFTDKRIKEVLRNQGVFTRLDRLSGNELSVFYLDSDNKRLLYAFNDTFLKVFDVPQTRILPFVMFFKIINRDAKDVEIIELEQSNIMFAFNELYEVIENYIAKGNLDVNKSEIKSSKVLRFFKSVKKITVEKFLEYLINKAIEYMGHHI